MLPALYRMEYCNSREYGKLSNKSKLYMRGLKSVQKKCFQTEKGLTNGGGNGYNNLTGWKRPMCYGACAVFRYTILLFLSFGRARPMPLHDKASFFALLFCCGKTVVGARKSLIDTMIRREMYAFPSVWRLYKRYDVVMNSACSRAGLFLHGFSIGSWQ